MSRRPEEVVRDVLAALERRDAEAIVECCRPDVVLEPASSQVAVREPYHGHDGIRRYVRDLAGTWEEFRVTVTRLEEHGHHVLALGRIYARSSRPAFVADSPVAVAWEIRDGRVAWAKVYGSEANARAAIAARAS